MDQSLNLEWVADAHIEVLEPVLIGSTPDGFQQVYPVGGGTVTGPQLKAIVVPGAADWQVEREDEVTTLDVTGAFITHDNVTCRISTRALFHEIPAGSGLAGSDSPRSRQGPYMRGVSQFHAPVGPYDWLNKYIHVMWGEVSDTGVIIHYYRVV